MSIAATIPAGIPGRIPGSIPGISPIYNLFQVGDGSFYNGFYFEASDPLTQYLLSTGATGRVTATNDAVGLWIDKHSYNGASVDAIIAAQTNKSTNDNSDPQDTTGLTKSQAGNNLGVISAVDDTAARVAAGLGPGNVIELDNSLGDATLFCNISGTVGNTNWHQVAVYARGTGTFRYGLAAESGADISVSNSAGYTLREMYFKPTLSTRVAFVGVSAGETAYFIFNTLKEVPGNHARQSNTGERPLWTATVPRYQTLDGSDDHHVTPLVPNTSITLAWAGTPTAASDIFLGSQPASNGKCYLGLDANGYIAGGVGTQTGSTIVDSTSTDVRGTRIVAVLTADGTTVRMFRGKTKIYEDAQSGAIDTANAIYIGALNNAGTDANNTAGRQEYPFCIHRALTENEVISTLVPGLGG
jgi:hypothetical protein